MRITSSASASCGIHLGDTKLVTSMRDTPALISASIRRALRVVGHGHRLVLQAIPRRDFVDRDLVGQRLKHGYLGSYRMWRRATRGNSRRAEGARPGPEKSAQLMNAASTLIIGSTSAVAAISRALCMLSMGFPTSTRADAEAGSRDRPDGAAAAEVRAHHERWVRGLHGLGEALEERPGLAVRAIALVGVTLDHGPLAQEGSMPGLMTVGVVRVNAVGHVARDQIGARDGAGQASFTERRVGLEHARKQRAHEHASPRRAHSDCPPLRDRTARCRVCAALGPWLCSKAQRAP